MAFSELFLYGGFAAGWLVGRWRPSRSPWVGRATFASVVALVALLGASFRSIAESQLADTLPWALGLAVGILATTAGLYLVLRRWEEAPREEPARSEAASPGRLPTSGVLVATLFAGYGVGRAVVLPTSLLLTVALVVLLTLVGYGIELNLASVRRAWLPIVSAVAGAGLVGLAAVLVGGLSAVPALATVFGFGWYSLAGPLVSARLGATFGLLAFLANFLREALTMVLAPYLGPRLRGEGLSALGGATAMDTTLYFVVRYGDRRAGGLAVASGLTLSIAAGLLVPFVLAL